MRKVFILLLFTIFIYNYNIIYAQWHKANIAYNGNFTSFANFGQNLFVGSDGGGVYLSTDNGLNWNSTNSGLTNKIVNALAVSGNYIFAGTPDGIFISTNNGFNWEPSNSGFQNKTCSNIICLAANDSNIYAGTPGGVYKYTKTSSSWQIFENTQVSVLAISGDSLFVGALDPASFSFLSYDGKTWRYPINFINWPVYAIAISDTNLFIGTGWGGGVLRSSDNFASWDSVFTGLPYNKITTAFGLWKSNLFLATSNTGLYVSTSNGLSYNEIDNTGLPANINISNIRIIDTNLIIGSKSQGIWVRNLTEITEPYASIDFNTNNIWYDTNLDGLESRTIDPNIIMNYGSTIKYQWSVGSKIISTSKNAEIKLPTGTWYVDLTLTSDKGVVKKDSVKISVIGSELITKGSIESAVGQLNDNTYFVTSKGGNVYCFDSTGTIGWIISTGGSIQSTTCISSQSNIYVGSNDTRLYSFDYQGIPRWDKAVGGTIVSSPSSLFDSLIYVGISTGRFFALDEQGNIKWSIQTGGSIASSASINEKGTAFVGSDDGKLYTVSSSGKVLWDYQTGGPIRTSPALGLDSSIIFGSNDGYLYKVDWNGKLLWKFQTGGQIKSSPIIGTEGTIYIGSVDGNLYCLSKNGNQLWKFNIGSSIYSTPSLGSNGSIYIGTMKGILYAIDPNGNEKWMLQTENPIIAPMLVTNKNMIMVGDTLGKLYILKVPDDNLIASINKNIARNINTETATSYEWWTYRGNNQRTGYRKSIILSVNNESITNPKGFELFQNYPNPFNPSTTLKYSITKQSYVSLKIFDILGREIQTLVNEVKPVGNYELKFNAASLPSGVLFYRIQAGSFNQVRKMLLIK